MLTTNGPPQLRSCSVDPHGFPRGRGFRGCLEGAESYARKVIETDLMRLHTNRGLGPMALLVAGGLGGALKAQNLMPERSLNQI